MPKEVRIFALYALFKSSGDERVLLGIAKQMSKTGATGVLWMEGSVYM